jgi:hypothetical protein
VIFPNQANYVPRERIFAIRDEHLLQVGAVFKSNEIRKDLLFYDLLFYTNNSAEEYAKAFKDLHDVVVSTSRMIGSSRAVAYVSLINRHLLRAVELTNRGMAMVRKTRVPDLQVLNTKADRRFFDEESYLGVMSKADIVDVYHTKNFLALFVAIRDWARTLGAIDVDTYLSRYLDKFFELKRRYERVVSLETLARVREKSINSLAQKYHVKLVSGEEKPIDEMPIERAASLASNPLRRVVEFICY